MTARDSALTVGRDVAEEVLGSPVEIEPLRSSGRNSRIYRLRSGKLSFALKQYPSRHDDPRDRLATEVAALRLMEAQNIDVVPRVVGMDHRRNYAILTWIEGAAVTEVGDADVDAAIAFLTAVHRLSRVPDAAGQPLASEACLCGREIERQIRERLGRLTAVQSIEPGLGSFLGGSLSLAIESELNKAKAAAAAGGFDFVTDLPPQHRALVPADFGFHNAIRRPNGSLFFIDFEYFGWDDPVKLIADVILHPGMSLSHPQKRRFRAAAERLYGEDGHFAARLSAYLPLFGLRWTLILLNEFIPERWSRRVLAGTTETWEEVKRRQLGRARDMLALALRAGEIHGRQS